MKRIRLLFLLLFSLLGGVGIMAQNNYYEYQSGTQNYVYLEQDGLYYIIYLNSTTPYASLQRGDAVAYVIEHKGNMEGYDYNSFSILPGYRGDVVVPEKVSFKGVDYPVNNMSDAFYNDSLLTSIKLPSTLTSLGSFYNTRIKTFEVPQKMAYFDARYFEKCKELQSFTVASGNESFKSIDGLLTDFSGTNLRAVPTGRSGRLVIPEGIEYYEYDCLRYATDITSIVIPSSMNYWTIQSISSEVPNVKIEISDNNPRYAINNGMITNKGGDSLVYIPSSNKESLTIPAGVKYILDSSAFGYSYYNYDTNQYYDDSRNPNVKIINLPASLLDLKSSNSSFMNSMHSALKLETVNVDAANPMMTSVNGVVMSKNKDTLFFVPASIAAKNALPATTKIIYFQAFRNNQNLKSLTVPNTVTEIGQSAFGDCRNLETVTIPATVKVLNMSLFENCISLKNVSLPEVDILPRSIFNNCSGLASITIPATVTTIEVSSFNNCKSLKEIKWPAALRTIRSNAFSGCTSLEKVVLPNGVEIIENYAFSHDIQLSGFTIPASVRTLGTGIFNECPLLQKVSVASGSDYFCDIDGVVFSADKRTIVMCPQGRKGNYAIPEGTHNIGNGAFMRCDSLTAITIPNSVDSVRSSAFVSIASIKELDFPAARYFDHECINSIGWKYNPVTHESYYTLERVIVRTSEKVYPSYVMGKLYGTTGVRFYCHRNNFSDWVNYSSDSRYTVFALDAPYTIANSTKYLKGFRFKVLENDLANMEKNLESIEVVEVNHENIDSDKKKAKKLADGTYYVEGLKTNTQYTANLNFKVKGNTESLAFSNLQTKNLSLGLNYKSTQSTINVTGVELRNVSDTTAVPKKILFTMMGKDYDLTETRKLSEPLKYEGLTPSTSFPATSEVTYSDGEVAKYSTSISTQGFNARGQRIEVTPTTLRMNITYNEIDAVPDSVLIAYSNSDTWSAKMDTLRAPVRNLVFTGLAPGKTYYRLNFFLKSGNTRSSFYFNDYTNRFETPQLTIETLDPKIPAKGRAIVEAKTNVSDDETHVGFEWRKLDAPSTLKSKSAFGVVFGGKAQGELSGLESNGSTYYNVRAFYEDMNGVRYYSSNGWVTFDPSDVSEFSATVHTNANPTVTNTSVVLVGMMIQGSEDIVEQGFEYWEMQTDENGKVTRSRIRKAEAEVEIHKIAVTGQRMEVQLTDLIPGTDYGYRAYVKTAKGTVYGEERTFRTNGERPTGIDEVMGNGQPLSVKVAGQRGSLRLNISADADKAVVTVVSLRGQLLSRSTVSADGSAVELNHLPSGIVLINVRTDNEEKTIKTSVR